MRTFQELLPLPNILLKKLFSEFDYSGKNYINVYRFLTGLVWTSYASKIQKINFIFQLFDFDKNGTLTIEEVFLIFVCSSKALSIMSGQADSMPKKHDLKLAAASIFRKADVDDSECLSLQETKQWVESRDAFAYFLDMFEPKGAVFNGVGVYNNFPEIVIDEMNKEPLDTR